MELEHTLSTKRIRVHLAEATQGEQDEDATERIYGIILRDPDFITSEVSGGDYIKLEMRLEKRQDADGMPALRVSIDAFTPE